MREIQLFCLPYAGGSATMYNNMIAFVHKNIKIVPIEIEGRGMRADEDHYSNLDELVDDVCDKILEKLEGDEFALFGYSMGGLTCYEVYYKLMNSRRIKPKHIFVAASTPPHIDDRRQISADLNDKEFYEKVIDLGGIPKEVLQDKDFTQYFMSIIRNDFRLYNNYKYMKKSFKIESDISVLYSDEENKNDNITEWKYYTSDKCKFYRFEGGHFFINNDLKKLLIL